MQVRSACLHEELNTKHDTLLTYAGKAREYNTTSDQLSTWYCTASKTPVIVEPIAAQHQHVKEQMAQIEVSDEIYHANLLLVGSSL